MGSIQPSFHISSRAATPVPAKRTTTPAKQPNQSARSTDQATAQSAAAAPPALENNDQSEVSSTLISETKLDGVSEGEWILRSEGQLTPRGESEQ